MLLQPGSTERTAAAEEIFSTGVCVCDSVLRNSGSGAARGLLLEEGRRRRRWFHSLNRSRRVKNKTRTEGIGNHNQNADVIIYIPLLLLTVTYDRTHAALLRSGRR